MAGGDTLLAVGGTRLLAEGDTHLLALGGDILLAEGDITEGAGITAGDLGSFSGAQ